MAWWNPKTWGKKPTPPPSTPSAPVYQGPIQPGIDEEIFRKTGMSIPIKKEVRDG